MLTEKELAQIESAHQNDHLKDFRSLKIDAVFDSHGGEESLRSALSDIKDSASQAIKAGVNILIISDRMNCKPLSFTFPLKK